jgi:DNA-binding NarL/FixJ family response regulator
MNPQVYIVGPHQLQNALMASFLESQTGLACNCEEPDLDSVVIDPSRCLILWDSQDGDLEGLWDLLVLQSNSESKNSFFALFNAKRDSKMFRIHREAVMRGVQGIFFENDPPESLSKGVQAILKGEYWISREFLNRCVSETRAAMADSQEVRPSLTRREKEILFMVASGASNEEIAYELGISYHTVKTHLSNIYKKINVADRLQASLWATKNL